MIATSLRWRLCLAAITACCALTACGGDDSTTPTPPTPTPTPTPETPQTPNPGTPPQMRCAP